ncbi:hypothetical protein DFP72DRAFT_822948 [Ephemerocybe angulata]|uniref:Transposase n=1 Tax=Ephemerocybe angulata TaxID=980116 RepID=A0A8H6HI76_9AGAR|nr:hypothetical protein DFP72DRAFT_822948 [Tulosesus angulatus]
MPRPASKDLKARIPILFYHHDFSVKEICRYLGVQKSLVYQSLAYFRRYGVAFNLEAKKGGRPRKLSRIDVKFISSVVQRRHCSYLDEIQDELFRSRGTIISITTLYRTLRRLNYTRKRVSAIALERNEMKRNAFWMRIADVVTDLSQLMFVDEAARNNRTSGRINGWAMMGKKCVQRNFFVRGQRWSILPILTIEGMVFWSFSGRSSSSALTRYHHARYHPWISHLKPICQIPPGASYSPHKSLSWSSQHPYTR